MKNLIYIFSLLTFYSAFGQNKTPEDFGYRHIVYNYKNESVDILVKSKKGEENVPKPIFIFCQGSLPIPLIIYDGKESFGTFPFNPDSISKNYHLVIIGKPSIPLIADVNTLQNDFT